MEAEIVRGLFEQGQLVEVKSATTGKWESGRVTHQHKNGKYTVTFTDDSKPQDQQPREKQVHPNRIRVTVNTDTCASTLAVCSVTSPPVVYCMLCTGVGLCGSLFAVCACICLSIYVCDSVS